MCPFESINQRCEYKRKCGSQVCDDIEHEIKCGKRKIIVVNFTELVDLENAKGIIENIRNDLGNSYTVIGSYRPWVDIKCINEEDAIIYIDGTKFHYSINDIRDIILKHEAGERNA